MSMDATVPFYLRQALTALTGDVYFAQGNIGLFPGFTSPALPPFTMTADRIGTMTLTFTGSTEARLDWTLAFTGDAIKRPGSTGTARTGSVLMRKFGF